MLYLISIPVFTNGKTDDTEVLLKIGYTRDGNLKARINCYGIPGIRVLWHIDGGTEIHEKSLHKYFEKYKYPKLDEWFYYSDEIVDKFKSFTLIDLDNIVNKVGGNLLKRGTFDYYKFTKNTLVPEIVYILRSIYPDEYIKSETIDSYMVDRTITRDTVMKKLEDDFGSEKINKLLSEMKSDEILLSKELSELKELTVYSDTLRYVCNNVDKNKIEKILKFTSLDISNYYIILGPTRMKAAYYRKDRLDSEYERLVNNMSIDIDTAIYSNFSAGDKISSSEIKIRLSVLYSNLGYVKTAKASDLGEWFETKSIKVKLPDNTWVHGFELIRKKKKIKEKGDFSFPLLFYSIVIPQDYLSLFFQDRPHYNVQRMFQVLLLQQIL